MGTTERREREKAKRRTEIVDAAEQLFFSKGAAAATMDDVADAAELSKGTLYLYFESKEDLLNAVIIRGILILQTMFEEAVGAREHGIDQVEAVGRAYLLFCQEHPDYFNAMMQFESSEHDTTGYAGECIAQSNRTFGIVAEAVRHGIEDGSIRADVDPMKIALTLYGLSTGLMQVISLKSKMMRDNHGIEPSDLVETFFDLIHKSLRS